MSLAFQPSVGRAQLSPNPNGLSVASFQFNLSNPGARSLAMGGAFAGLADDATAAYANPAGLTILTRPEVSYEGRQASFSAPFIDSLVAFAPAPPSPDGDPEFGGTGIFETAPLGEPELGGASTSFVSFVYPHRRLTLALYRHQLADLGGGAAAGPADADRRLSLGLDVVGLGLAAGYRVNDRLSLGAGLVRYESSIGAVDAFESRSEDSFSERSWSLTSGDATTAVNLGLLARLGDRWSIGAFFREGPRFAMSAKSSSRGSFSPPSEDMAPAQPFRVPDVYGVGTAWKATPSLLVMTEWDRVRYSSLARETPLSPEAGAFRADDADEFRAGVEYSFWRRRSAPALRLGAWLDPDHKVRFEPALTDPGVVCEENRCSGIFSHLAVIGAALAALYPPGKDELHFTGGFGLVPFPGLQVDAAFDVAESGRSTFSLSGVTRF